MNKKSTENVPLDMDLEFNSIFYKCKDYTMTSVERMYSVYNAVKYVLNFNIPGDLVECGVWKGGSSMVSALTMLKMGNNNRNIYLYDTYSGMPEPTKKDVDFKGKSSFKQWKKSEKKNINGWCFSPLEEVQKNIFSTGYPKKNLYFVKGKVEDTIPQTIPKTISILRLDTDWYESTYHELEHLFPRLSKNGVLILDDYGHWKGSKDAVDQYFQENNINILLNRIDYTGRMGIKTD